MSNDNKWTRQAIFDACDGQVSKTCIVRRDDEWVIEGKSCIVSPCEDGTWDIWICDPKNLVDGLHQRSVSNRVNRLKKHAVEGSLNELAGEAWMSVRSIDFIRQDPVLCKLLGIRRKRSVTPARRKTLIEQLPGIRNAKRHEQYPASP